MVDKNVTRKRKKLKIVAEYARVGLSDHHINFTSILKVQLCTGDCSWKGWGPWNRCSKSCGSGTRKRTRTVFKGAHDGGKECEGSAEEIRPCNTNECHGEKELF